jgi:hypothetical protein
MDVVKKQKDLFFFTGVQNNVLQKNKRGDEMNES